MKRCGSYSDVSHKVQMSSSNLVGTPGSVGHTAPSPHLPVWSVGWFEAAWGRYVSANTSSAFLPQSCPVSVEVISRTVLITSPGDNCKQVQACDPVRDRHAVWPMCSANCAFPRTQGGTDCVSLPAGYHDEAPLLSRIGEILDLCGQSPRVERQDRLALDVQVRVLQQVRYCLDGNYLPALCSEHRKMMLLKEPG